MKYQNRLTLLTAALLFFVGCSSDEVGFKDGRPEVMQELTAVLDDEKIAYRLDEEGYIYYSKNSDEKVNQLIQEIKNNRLSEVGEMFDDLESTLYFQALLKERNISFRTEERDDGLWVYWIPENKKQEDEIIMKVISNSFDRQETN